MSLLDEVLHECGRQPVEGGIQVALAKWETGEPRLSLSDYNAYLARCFKVRKADSEEPLTVKREHGVYVVRGIDGGIRAIYGKKAYAAIQSFAG